jgi:hypothetical protein
VIRRLLLAVLAAALVAGPLLEPALAKRPKAKMTATVDGKKFKGMKNATSMLYATTSFSVNTQTKVKKGISRALTIVCGPGIDLRALPVPSQPLSCIGIYQINPVRGGDQQTYIGPTPTMELVVESIVDTLVTGTFRGTIPHSTDPAAPPVTIEDGRFTAFMLSTGV